MRDFIPRYSPALALGTAGFFRNALNRAPDNIAGVRSLVTPQIVGNSVTAIVSFGAFVACLNSGSGNVEERSFLDTHLNGNFAHDTIFGTVLSSLLASGASAAIAFSIFAFASTVDGVDGFRRAINYARNNPGSASITGLNDALRRINDNRDDLQLNLAITSAIVMAFLLLVDHETNRDPFLVRIVQRCFPVEQLRLTSARLFDRRFDRMDDQFRTAFSELRTDLRGLVAEFVGGELRIEEPSQGAREDLGRFPRREGVSPQRPGLSPRPRTIGNISRGLSPD